MIRQQRQRFARSKGFSLGELALGLLVVSCLMGLVVSLWSGATTLARGQRTMKELASILGVGRQYYDKNGSWPADIPAVQTMMPLLASTNVFGFGYTVSGAGMTFSVETTVPPNAVNALVSGGCVVMTDVSPNKKVRVSTTLMLGRMGRLQYDKKYIYP